MRDTGRTNEKYLEMDTEADTETEADAEAETYKDGSNDIYNHGDKHDWGGG